MRWEVNTIATSMSSIATETLEHDSRKAMVNLTELGDGTAIVSASLVVPAEHARQVAELLLARLAQEALSL